MLVKFFCIWESKDINPSCPNPVQKEKILFSHFFAVPQKVFIKPSAATQRNVKIKFWLNCYNLLKCGGQEGLTDLFAKQ